MSRCFPFPPPGYERKHRLEDLELLKEAKRKEKKHKKERKDKERKKDKEKKEKDGSDEKRRDKKDRKEKHKDKKERDKEKKKDKDRGKDKDKSSISEETTVAAGKLEDGSGVKFQPKVQSSERSGFGNEAKSSMLFQGQNGENPSHSSLLSHSNEESKFVQELDRRIRDDQRGAGSQLPERVAIMDNKDQQMVSRGAIRNSSGLLVGEKVDSMNKRIDRKNVKQEVKNDFGGSKVVQSLVPITKAKAEVLPKPVDEQNGRRREDKDKCKETSAVKQGDKQKDRDKESPTKKKEKKKDRNSKIKNEKSKHSSQSQLRTSDSSGFNDKLSMASSKEANSNVVNEGNIKKRKDEYTNGFLHESEIRPNKMQKLDSYQLAENGRKVDPFHTPAKPSHDKPTFHNSTTVDNRERLMNGFIGAHKPSPPPKSKPSTAIKAPHHDSHSLNKALKVPKIEDLIAEASTRPPHPDSKYMVEVLTVPETVDWSEHDDQEWLYKKEGRAGKHKVELDSDNEDQHVWSEAIHIESADVYALPYVIPF